jgi:hypothetical protein
MKKPSKRFTRRIRAWHDLASPADKAKGKLWYRTVHERAAALADETGLSIAQVCGVISALSPACEFGLNLRQAEALCRQWAEGGPLDEVVLSTYGKQQAKAKRIVSLAGHHTAADVGLLLGKRALKTLAFFYNILNPDESTSVTIDVHIIASMDFSGQFVQGALWCYNRISKAFQAVAEELRLRPCELQAIVWLAYKSENSRNFAEELTYAPSVGDDDDLPEPPDDAAPF